LQPRPQAVFRQHIAVTNATGLNLDENMANARLRYLPFDKFQRAASLRHLHCFHRPHRFLPHERSERGLTDPVRRFAVDVTTGHALRLAPFL